MLSLSKHDSERLLRPLNLQNRIRSHITLKHWTP
jgi:hypothetical protein